MMQQNRFCGIVLKNRSLEQQLPGQFNLITSTYYLQSDIAQSAFDGYINGEVGAWSRVDLVNDQLRISTDRVGVRSIYYSETESFICFANTIAGLRQIPFLEVRPSEEGVFRFLMKGTTNELLDGISLLMPEQELRIDLNDLSSQLLEKENLNRPEKDQEEEEWAIQTRSLLKETVGTVIADASNIGTFLSGGIDSSVIACAANLNGHQLPAITALSDDDRFDETNYAGSMMAALGWNEWHQVVAGDISRDMEEMHLSMELPTTSMGSYLQFELMRFCGHQGIQNVLDGTGADALYAGHNYYEPFYWNELITEKAYSTLKSETRAYQGASSWWKYYAKNVLKYYYLPRFNPATQWRMAMRGNELLQGLSPEFSSASLSVLSEKPSYDLKNLNLLLQNDFFGGPVRELLRFTDRMGKSFGVMNHPVFAMNPELYLHALSIPSSFKIQNGIKKSILRKAFAECLPPPVLQRKEKMGLVAPNNLWMKKHKDLLLSYINEDVSQYYNIERMKDLLAKAIDEAGDIENYKVFKFFSFAIWHKVMIS